MKITKHFGALFLILFTLILILQQTIEVHYSLISRTLQILKLPFQQWSRKPALTLVFISYLQIIDPVTDGEISEAYDIRESLLASNPYFYIKEIAELEADETDYPNK